MSALCDIDDLPPGHCLPVVLNYASLLSVAYAPTHSLPVSMKSRFYIFITILCITKKNTLDKRESVMELLIVDKNSRITPARFIQLIKCKSTKLKPTKR